jgi:hypothetical protein
MKGLAIAIAFATVLASPMNAKTQHPRHPAAATNHQAPNSPYVGVDLGTFGNKQPASRFEAPLDDFQSNRDVSY